MMTPEVKEITLAANEKYVGITGHAHETSGTLTTRKMKADEQPETYKVYDLHTNKLVVVVKEWRQ
jgi:hypothetical protein